MFLRSYIDSRPKTTLFVKELSKFVAAGISYIRPKLQSEPHAIDDFKVLIMTETVSV